MSFNEKKKAKSKNTKKCHDRIEAIKVTVERKKKCNDKALQIVTDFSEGTVSEDVLIDNLKFINQEHYQDIVEERAISKFCGYPLCSKQLKNIPSKQYHISTTLNKVFDITDRKNFCSNMCYKASRFLKDQVSTSPLWFRDDESTTFRLISLESRGGMSGDEVDLGVSSMKLDIQDLTATCEEPKKDTRLGIEPELTSNEPESKRGEQNNVNDLKKNIDEQCTNNKYKTRSQSPDDHCRENLTCENNCEFTKDKDSSKDMLTETEHQDDIQHQDILSQLNDLARPTQDNVASEHQSSNFTKSPENFMGTTSSKKEESSHSSVPVNQTCTRNMVLKSHIHSSKNKSSIVKNKNPTNVTKNKNPVQSVVLKIEKFLREWISMDTLCFVFGEDKIKEILAENKNTDLAAFSQDVHFYERYLAICKKLNVLELEDTKIDASYRDEAKQPLPDYEALKEEARQMEIKVRMFLKGDKVQFEDTEQLNKETKTDIGAVDFEPVLPLVDVHAQKALRRRIVIDKLRRVLQDLQKSLGLRGFNLTEDVRTLVGTLTLSAHNITMRPAEWNLISIAVIKLLSLRDSLLAEALNSSTASKHLTLLLMSYSLDAGYLDRLMVWLTDVEAVLQKT